MRMQHLFQLPFRDIRTSSASSAAVLIFSQQVSWLPSICFPAGEKIAMAYSESLAARIRQVISREPGITEKKMFGGVGFLLNGNMCVGVWKTSLIARLGTEQAEEALKAPHVVDFDVTGRPMKGWVMIEADGVDTEGQLSDWIQRSVEFVRTLPRK